MIGESINDSAFPTNNGPDRFNSAGMSLRDYFAAKAMQALLHSAADAAANDEVEKIAPASYEMADAMLKARSA